MSLRNDVNSSNDLLFVNLRNASRPLSSNEHVNSSTIVKNASLPALSRGVRPPFIARREVIKKALRIHKAPSPAASAGEWIFPQKDNAFDWLQTNQSAHHLKCLDQELQGNCHVDFPLKEVNSSRHKFMAKPGSAILNSPSILHGENLYSWRPRVPHPALNVSLDDIKARVKSFKNTGGKIRLIGDSLSRQFYQTLVCMLSHKLQITDLVRFHWSPVDPANAISFVKPQDLVVFNFGHHVDPSKSNSLREIGKGGVPKWETKYSEALKHLFKLLSEATKRQQVVDPSRIVFRTTDIRHHRANESDWDGGIVSCGSSAEPGIDFAGTLNASWGEFGGLYPALPRQNEILLEALDSTDYALFDASPLTLSRRDATFDCSHFCLPGPMDTLSALLLVLYLPRRKAQMSIPVKPQKAPQRAAHSSPGPPTGPGVPGRPPAPTRFSTTKSRRPPARPEKKNKMDAHPPIGQVSKQHAHPPGP